MSYTKAVASNTIIQIIGRVVITAVALITTGIITRYLGVFGFGQLQTVFSYLAMFTVLADLGFFFIIVRDLSALDSQEEKVNFIGNALTIRIIAALVVYAIAAVVGFFIYKEPVIFWGIVFLSISFFALTLQNTVISVFQSTFRMDKTVIADIVGKTATLALIVYAMSIDKGLIGIYVAYIVGSLLNLAVALIMANKIIPIRLRFDLKIGRKILAESAPMGLAVILSTLYFKIDSVILSLIKGSFDVGIYGVPYKIIEVILAIPAIFANTILPIYSRYYRDRDKRLGNSLQRAFDGLMLMATPVTVGLIVMAKPIIQVIGGDEFIASSTITIFGSPATSVTALKILALAVGLAFISQAFSYLISAGGYQRKLILPNLLFVVFNVTANYFLIRHFSYFAAAWVTVATEILVLTTMTYLVSKYFNLSVNLHKTAKILLAGVVMYLAIAILTTNLIWAIIIGTVVYSLMIFITKAITKQDIIAMMGK